MICYVCVTFQVGTDSGFTDDTAVPHNIPSIFERPGFGSVAFRNSISATMTRFPTFGIEDPKDSHVTKDSSIGSAGSLNQRSTNGGSHKDHPEEHSDDDGMSIIILKDINDIVRSIRTDIWLLWKNYNCQTVHMCVICH